MLKKGDIILIAGVLAVVVLGFGLLKMSKTMDDSVHRIAVIKQEDRIIKKIDLDTVTEPQRITVGGAYSEVILVEKGRIRFEEADCPDKVCVKTGWLSNPGDKAVCLPNRTIIKIEGENSEVDGVTY